MFGLITIAWFKPWDFLDISWRNLVGLETIKVYSGVSVFSLKDQIEVYVDNEFKDNVDASGGLLEISQIEPGIHRVTIKKKVDGNVRYYEFSKSLNFVQGVSNVIAYELGPSKEFSQGHVFYTEKKIEPVEQGKTLISFLSSIPEIEVYLDDKLIGQTPLKDFEISLAEQQIVKLRKDGYEELSFKILPESLEDRKKLESLHLYIEAELFLKPLEISKEK